MHRRHVVKTLAISSFAAFIGTTRDSSGARPVESSPEIGHRSQSITAADGTKLFVQDWGSGQPIVFLSAWTLNSNVWGTHMATLMDQGFRCVAPDRRGHGRSDSPASGYDVETLVDDLAAVLEQKDLKQVVLVAHSMGSIEAARYCGRHGTQRIARLVLAAPVTPFLTQAPDNPDALPIAAISAQHAAITKDFPKWIAENENPFFTPDTVAETRSWIKNMMLNVSLPVALKCGKSIATTDTRDDLRKIATPTLIIQGDKDASAPLSLTGAKTARLIAKSKLIVYPGAPHALVLTHRERFIADMLAFIGQS